jgi:hypothetical protein
VVVAMVNHDTVHPGGLVSLDSTCADAILGGSPATRFAIEKRRSRRLASS